MERSIAIIDPSAGVSGDMLLGALVAAGVDPEWLRSLPRRLGLHGVTVEIGETQRAAIRATKVTVRLADGAHEGLGDAHAHLGHDAGHHGHGEHAAHSHRHVSALLAQIEAAELTATVKQQAMACFRLLAEAEGQIHGMPAEKVALHEVGAADALVDIVGVIEGFERLGVAAIYSWPVALGNGWIRAAHGVMPVPAPATSLLLEGIDVRTDGPARGEATTPTGAALIRVLSRGAPPEGWRVVRGAAFGAGERNPAEYANVVRLLIATVAEEAADIVVLATDVDDLSPEYLEPVREALTVAGALDVQVWATMGKKGRVSFRIEALAPAGDRDAVAAALLTHSTTAGLRFWSATRTTLQRRSATRPAEDGMTVRVKVIEAPDGLREKPELDDIQAVARVTGRPVHRVARELLDQGARSAGLTGARASTTSTSQE
jgi:uncharacterized protein (TIGR00299 family) protein